MKVIRYPHPTLLQAAAPVDLSRPGQLEEVCKRVEQMFQLMIAERGVGLAAPQVDWPVRLFVMSPTDATEDRQVLINPRILKRAGRVSGEEGCLSLPGIYIDVSRARGVDVAYVDLDGREVEGRFDDFAGRVVQHEYDHLEGITLVERMSPTDRTRYRDAIHELGQSLA